MSTVAAPLLVSPSGAPLLSASDQDWRIVAPFPERAWPRVWIWMEDFRASVMDDFAPQNMEAFVEQRMQAAGFELTYGVAKGDELGGLITVQPLSTHLASAHFLFKKSFWEVIRPFRRFVPCWAACSKWASRRSRVSRSRRTSSCSPWCGSWAA